MDNEGKNTEAAVASDEDLCAMGAAKLTRGKNRPVDSTDRKNKNSSKKETVIMKKKITLNEDGEVVSEDEKMSKTEIEKLNKKRKKRNKRKNRKKKEEEEMRNLDEEDKNRLKELEQVLSKEEIAEALKNRRVELDTDIEETQHQMIIVTMTDKKT